MKTLVSFFFGIMLMALALAITLTGGKSFDVSRKFSVNSVIFQPADLSRDRIEKPVALDVLSDEFVRDSLIKKFVNEYFYIVPDAGDMARRKRTDSTLARMSDPAVFDQWNEKFAEDMEKLADQNVMRRVVVNSIVFPPNSEYFQVSYDLMTWDVANDITRAPMIQKNKSMSIRLNFEKGVRQQQTNGARFDVKKYLEDGGDPATIFRFRALEVVVK